ncbi:MAG TPA: hypothetical protein VMF08_10130 [Candidatus Sulfotelmatobacter sp.]|nr:hypothetical protein [Candidatus Sulfotelmatobacter sp.]
MSRNEINDNKPPLLTAGLMCLVCVPVLFLTTRPVVWLSNGPWVAWLLGGSFIIVPLAVTFIVLYRSAWHDDRPQVRRIISVAVSSCIIFVADLLLVAAVIIVGCLIAGLSRVMGGN